MKTLGKLFTVLLFTIFCSCMENENETYRLINRGDGKMLGYSNTSGVKIIKKDGYSFKDLNRTGVLEPYEDWRLSADERAKDLASRLSVEEMAGLMLYSSHQGLPNVRGNYGGKPYLESGSAPWELSDEQQAFLKNDNMRHVLVTTIESTEASVKWNNLMQAYVEGLGMGVPVNICSDPRHAGVAGQAIKAEFNEGSSDNNSVWPEGLALAATFDPHLARRFGEVASQEYRALGISTALHPQIDLATDPRWFRNFATFGESPQLATDMGRAYTDGFQTSAGSYETENGWGYHSVNAMAKHWPGGGTGEAGRDGHWAFGKFGVYPGNNFEEQLKPFIDGALKLDGKTGETSAIMPYYTIAHGQAVDGTELGSGYSNYLLNVLLRGKYGYDGVICSDWAITKAEGDFPDDFRGKPWGVETLTDAERHYKALMAGIDQFGGNDELGPVLEAYAIGVSQNGESFMRKRFQESAVRILKNIFRLGLFENPYLDLGESKSTVGNPRFVNEGYEAQIKSVVLLKNSGNVLPVKERKKVYIPKNFIPSVTSWFGGTTEESVEYTIDLELVKRYYDLTENPNEADFAIVFITSPYGDSNGGGFDREDFKTGGNGYVPITLQYKPYTAIHARERSIAAGDPVIAPQVKDRSYKGKTATAVNSEDLNTVLSTCKSMGNKPVIVVANVIRPMVFGEFEQQVTGIIARFGIGEKAILDIISGKAEPSGLLPAQMPADMETVEKQCEDVPFDMNPYIDSDGNRYDFAYGMNWNGVIADERTKRYSKP